MKKAEEAMEILEASDKRWQDGDMRVRRTAAGMLVAEEQFRRIVTEVPRESIEHARSTTFHPATGN